MKIAEIRHPVGNLRVIQGQWKKIVAGYVLCADQGIILMHHADKHAYAMPIVPSLWLGQRLRRIAGIFDRFPASFKEQPLLRVHRFGFPRRYPKKLGIKAVWILDKSSPSGHMFP
ncbi:hypothetical protein D3C73_409420 [compost metagenome]